MELEKLIALESQLDEELSLLRNQISAMQASANELMKTNKMLDLQVRKLTDANIELLRLQEQKDSIFTEIIKDIQSPAQLIKDLVSLLTSYDVNAREKMNVVENLTEISNKIILLSSEVSKFIAYESVQLNLEFDKVQINYIADDAIRLNRKKAENLSIEIISELQEDLPEAEVDAQRFFEILDNILMMSIRFTHQGGMIKFRTYFEEGRVICEVVDNGFGLSTEDIEEAFKKEHVDPKMIIEKATTSGLGLWVVKKLVDSHNGKIFVKSTLGKGTIYNVSIPLTQSKEVVN